MQPLEPVLSDKRRVRSFELRATISNCSNNYGPRQWSDEVIPRHVTNISAIVPSRIAIARTSETGFTSTITILHNITPIGLIISHMGGPEDAFDLVGDRAGHHLRYAIDATKLISELGWNPRHTNIESGLASTIMWYRKNRSGWRPFKDSVGRTYAKAG